MSKQALVSKVEASGEFDSSQAAAAVDAVFEAVKNSLSSGEEVSVPGFGKFSVSDRAAREGRNPSTGETLQIAATKVPKFSAAKALKDAVKS